MLFKHRYANANAKYFDANNASDADDANDFDTDNTSDADDLKDAASDSDNDNVITNI